jgi:hypothetical protein
MAAVEPPEDPKLKPGDLAASIENIGRRDGELFTQDRFYQILSHSVALVGVGNPLMCVNFGCMFARRLTCAHFCVDPRRPTTRCVSESRSSTPCIRSVLALVLAGVHCADYFCFINA